MKNILNEEISRMRFLYSYKNQSLISEQRDDLVTAVAKKFFPKLLGTNTLLAKNFVTHIDEIIVLGPGSKYYDELPSVLQGQNIDDVLTKLVTKGSITDIQLGEFLMVTFKKTLGSTDDEIAQKIAQKLVNGKKFNNLAKTKTEDEMIAELTSANRTGATKFTDDEARALVNQYKKQGGKFKVVGNPTPSSGRQLWNYFLGGMTITTILSLGVAGYILYLFWDNLVKSAEAIKKTGLPDCLIKKAGAKDSSGKRPNLDAMNGKSNDSLLIMNTGIPKIDKQGGGRFYIHGKFRSNDGTLKGEWEEDPKFGIIINIDGQDYPMSCENSEIFETNTDNEDLESDNFSKTTKFEYEPKIEYKVCENPPYTLGCKDGVYNNTIKRTQECVGYSNADGKVTPEFLKYLKDNKYNPLLDKEEIQLIKQQCKTGRM